VPKVQPIFRENPGSLPAEYVLPAGLELVLSSVVARFNGAAAAATFVPVLEVLTQDAKLIARIRPDQEFAVGDTGVVTFAPFLRRDTGGGLGHPRAVVTRVTTQSIASATFVPIQFTTAVVNEQAIWAAGNPNRLTAPVSGMYFSACWLSWVGSLVGNVGLHLRSFNGDFISQQFWQAASGTAQTKLTSSTGAIAMNGGDWIEWVASHDIAGNQNITEAVANLSRYGTFSA